MNIELTKSQIRKIVIGALLENLEDKDSELNFAIKYALCKAYRFGGDPSSYTRWEFKKK
jgi:hypothetical protein